MPDRRDIGRLAIKGIITSAYSLASLLALGLPGPAEAPKHGALQSPIEDPKLSIANESFDLGSPQYKRVQRHLAQGWNTWDVHSVTTHVLLPEGLAIHVGLQHNSAEDGGAFLEDTIEGRRTRDSEQLALGPHSWNGSYTDLQVSWRSHWWRIQSAHIGKDLVLLASPLSSPPQLTLVPTIVFWVNFLWDNPGTTIRRPGYIEAHGPSGNVAIFCTCTRSQTPRGLDGSGNALTGGNTDFPVKSPYFAMEFTRPLGISTGKRRSLAEIEAILYQQNAIRQKSIVAGDAAASIEDAIQTTLGWNTIYDPDNHRVITPVGRNWSAANGGYVLFEWDTMFTATMASSGDRNLAYANVIEILRGERPEGFIPNYTRAGHHELGDQQTSDRSQPPIGSMTVLGLYERFHDRWLLEQAFQPLLNWNRWWPAHRDMEGYLTWGSDGENQPVDITDHSRGARQGAIYESGTLSLGQRQPVPLPQPRAGAPKWSDDGRLITVEGAGFSLVLDRATGDFDAANPKHRAPILTFPSLHVTRHDFGDLDAKKPPYAELPDARTRFVESVTMVETSDGLELTVKDHYADFAGTVSWLMDKDGVGRIRCDYTYTVDNLDSREIGIKALLPASYDEVKWRRWSEWGIFPKGSISRTEGTAKARRDKKWPNQPPNVKPAWPWSQDQTELGTAEFRSIKLCIYEAQLPISGIRLTLLNYLSYSASGVEPGFSPR
jgi:hypothetical protein